MTPPNPAVAAAIDAVRAQFVDHQVEVTPDGAGGANVIIHSIEVGDRYNPSSTWLGFQVNAAYPASDVYPHYLGVVTRVDGQPHGQGVGPTTWQERAALQLSRRSNGWNPAIDNAVLKAEKVIQWFSAL